MIRRLKSIVLVSFILSVFNDPVHAESIKPSNSTCQEVGIILQSPNPNLNGLLCKGDRLTIESKVLVSCRFKPTLKWLTAGEHDINQYCPSERLDSVCKDKRSCYRNTSGIKLIGNTFASQDPMPTLRWHPVQGASGYEIMVHSSLGNDVRRALISVPEYSFSAPLEYGELYELEIFALNSTYSGRFAYYIPSQETIKEMRTSLDAVQNSELSLLDQAIYQDSIYMSLGLLSEAIQSLEESPALEKSFELKFLLGDRYLLAGYYDKAKANYKKITQVASEGSQPHSQALELLKLYSQLPTRTKLPQL